MTETARSTVRDASRQNRKTDEEATKQRAERTKNGRSKRTAAEKTDRKGEKNEEIDTENRTADVRTGHWRMNTLRHTRCTSRWVRTHHEGSRPIATCFAANWMPKRWGIYGLRWHRDNRWEMNGLAQSCVRQPVCGERTKGRVGRMQYQSGKRALRIRGILDFEEEK